MTDVQLHEPGACPGGCEEIKTVEQRLDDGAIRMANIEASLSQFSEKLDAHTRMSAETNSTVSEVLEILHAGKGFFKVYDGTGQYHGYIDINTGHLEVAPEDL